MLVNVMSEYLLRMKSKDISWHDPVISINARGRPFKRVRKLPWRYLYIEFNDNDDKTYGPITEKDADRIISFIDRCKKWNVNKIWMHCYEGNSRSPSVAEFMKNYYGFKIDYFDDIRNIHPNEYVYKILVKQYRKKYKT